MRNGKKLLEARRGEGEITLLKRAIPQMFGFLFTRGEADVKSLG